MSVCVSTSPASAPFFDTGARRPRLKLMAWSGPPEDPVRARNGESYLAYQDLGEGPLDIVVIESWAHHVEAFWEIPELARQRRRLASIGRLIIFDRRGTGLSDPVAPDHLPDLETQVADVIAVMDAAGSSRRAILGFAEGGPLALHLAARCRSDAARSCSATRAAR